MIGTLAIDGALVRRLDRADVPAVQDLVERCADHFVLHDGEPPGADAAEVEFGDLPPGCTLADKHIHGVLDPVDPARSWRCSNR